MPSGTGLVALGNSKTRTITNTSLYDDAHLDLRRGHGVTFTNPIRTYGTPTIDYPAGMTVALA